MVEGREEFVRKQSYIHIHVYMYMHMHNKYKQKVTHSHFYTLNLFFYPSVKDQTLLQAPQRMSILPNTALKRRTKCNGIACAFTRISKLNIIKIAQVSF